MTSLNTNLFGGSDATKAAFLKDGLILGEVQTSRIPLFSGTPGWGNKIVIRWQQVATNDFNNVLKDLVLRVKLGAITQTTGDSEYCQGIGLQLFQDLTVRSRGIPIIQNLDCSKLWPFLVYATRDTELKNLRAKLHMSSTDAKRRAAIDIFLPLDMIFTWCNDTPLDIVNQNELQIEFTFPSAASVISTSGTYVVPSINVCELVADREYNKPYINAMISKFKAGFQVEDPRTFQTIVQKPGFSLPDFNYLNIVTPVGAADTSVSVNLGQFANRMISCLFCYVQSNADLAATTLTYYNNYKPITSARVYYSNIPLDNTDNIEYKDYPFLWSMIDGSSSQDNIMTYLIGDESSGGTDNNMIIIPYSDAINRISYRTSAGDRFVGYMSWEGFPQAKFDLTFPALGGTGGTVTVVAVCYRQMAITGNVLGNCSVVNIFE